METETVDAGRVQWGTGKLPRLWAYRPLPDITTWELARIMPVFTLYSDSQLIRREMVSVFVQDLPPECQRHFEEVKS